MHWEGGGNVTTTTAHGLPYQQAGDRPCDAPDVWCAFANALEANLYATDQLIGRINPTIPMAKMTRSTVVNYSTTTALVFPVRFDGVEVDTDDMVDFAISQYDIKPRRFGTYLVTAQVSVSSGDVDNLSVIITRGPVTTSPTSATYTTMAQESQRRPATTNPYTMRVSAHLSYEADDSVGFGLIVNPMDGGNFNINSAALGVYWVSDVAVFG